MKDKFKINRIILKDNSFLICDYKQQTVKLAQLRMITHGKPWYAEYGFKPYDNLNERPDKKLEHVINKNNIILDKLKTNCIDIINIVKDAIIANKLNDIDIAKIKQLMKNYPMMRSFIIRLSNELDKYCVILNSLLRELYDPSLKIGLTNLFGTLLYLDI